jgi:hypothetical protein
LVVGFLNEPAYSHEVNGLDLRVTVPSENNRPVEGLADTLKASVIVGGGARTMPLELRARFGQPGAYAGYFMPTREGSYIFRVAGTIEGTPVDERFESGPGRFNDVQSVQPLQFPDSVPDTAALAREVQAARDEAAMARLLAMAGLAVGLIGIAIAGRSRFGARRPETVSGPRAAGAG